MLNNCHVVLDINAKSSSSIRRSAHLMDQHFWLSGPTEGLLQDLTLFRGSRCNTVLQECLSIVERLSNIYRYQAYILLPSPMKPFAINLIQEQATFDAQMTALIVSVEHNYKDFMMMWTSQDFPGKVKVRQAPICAIFKATALLFNS